MTASRQVVLISEAFVDTTGPARLERHGFEVEARHDLVHTATTDQLAEALSGAWAVVAGAERYAGELLDRLPSLRAIARPGVGVDAIDVGAASRGGIAVLITPNANDESVADHTLALILAGLRRTLELDRSTRAGQWRRVPRVRDLHGATVGVVGLGAIGRAVVRRLHGFDCRILAVEPLADRAFCDRYGVEVMTLHEMLSQVQVVTVHVPLTPATRGLIGADELALLSSDALVVNAARGSIIDEPALVAALEAGTIGGAALDVFGEEPLPSNHPLAGFTTVTLSPHYAAFSVEAVARMVDGTVANLIDVSEGRLPAGCINAAALTPTS